MICQAMTERDVGKKAMSLPKGTVTTVELLESEDPGFKFWHGHLLFSCVTGADFLTFLQNEGS